MDTSDSWILDRVGIKSRYVCTEDESCVGLAESASRIAMQRAGLSAEDIDIVVFATVTPDQQLPSAAALLAHRLGIHNSMAFDIGAACSGFLFAIATADSLLTAIGGKNALIVGAEALSRVVDWRDRNTAVLFGDGAGVCILQQPDSPHESCILGSYLKTAADGAKLIQRSAGAYPACQAPATAPRIDEGASPYIVMAGREVFRAGVRCMTQSIQKVLNQANVTIDDIRLFIPHQSNIRMIQAVCDSIGLTNPECLGANIERVGNTSAASIPIVLDEYARSGQLQQGDLVLLTAVGSGMTYGSILLRW
jgi:3-oxoacyl-[acyl-carrier-protein] synthase-3